MVTPKQVNGIFWELVLPLNVFFLESCPTSPECVCEFILDKCFTKFV